MFYYDWTMILLIPGILLTFWAQARVKSAYSKYSHVGAYCGMTGAQVAEHMLRSEAIYDVNIEVVSGSLTDHYDPSSRTLRLSEGVAYSSSLAALGVAAHETGHAAVGQVGYAAQSGTERVVENYLPRPVAHRFKARIPNVQALVDVVVNVPYELSLVQYRPDAVEAVAPASAVLGHADKGM